MTEAEWDRGDSLDLMLDAARRWVGKAGLRRYAAAWVGRARDAVPLGRRTAGGWEDTAADTAARAEAGLRFGEDPIFTALQAGRAVALAAVYGRDRSPHLTDPAPVKEAYRAAAAEVIRAQKATLRCLVRHPLSRVSIDPGWHTSAVRGLVGGIAADDAVDRLPMLADALEEAGCDQADLLAHLRGDGPHVRGCWALDLVLGKG